jgi:hypothetical protein
VSTCGRGVKLPPHPPTLHRLHMPLA